MRPAAKASAAERNVGAAATQLRADIDAGGCYVAPSVVVLGRGSRSTEELARKDSNLDKVIQSHLCYRYTTGQGGRTTDLTAKAGAVK